MGPRIEGGHDDLGTGPERARPRLLRLGHSRGGRCAGGQRESERAGEGSEPAAARAHEGEQVIEVLKRERKSHECDMERIGVIGFGDIGIGKGIMEASLQGWLNYSWQAGMQAFFFPFESGEMDNDFMQGFASFYTPPLT